MVTDSWAPAGRSATRSRIGSGRVSWRRRLCAFCRRDAQVGAHRDDPVVVVQGGAGLPAVGELGLLVDEAEGFCVVGLGLDPADLLAAGVVVEQQHDQGGDRGEAFEAFRAGQSVAGAGGEQPALAVEQHHRALLGVRGAGRCTGSAGPCA